LTTTTVVSALPATSTSTWPTPTVSTIVQPAACGQHQYGRTALALSQLAADRKPVDFREQDV
jgi:hypothetical protein